MLRILPLLALLVAALLLPQAAAADSARIIVKRAPGLTAAQRADLRSDAGVRLVRPLALPRTEVVASDDPSRALAALNADPAVAYAELDRPRRALATDPGLTELWALENTGRRGGVVDADMDVLEAWPLATGAGQTVAVVDSGADVGHPDLAGQISPASWNFVGTGGPDVTDGDGHGTHVTGTVVALRDNGEGIAGVAPRARVLALRALDDTGSGYDSDIAEAFRYAGAQGVRIVNASLGAPGASETLRSAIAAHPETLFVVAAGNDGTDNDARPTYPCNTPEPNVLCVGASTNTESRASFSNHGLKSVDVFAPGKDILSTVPAGVVDGFASERYLFFSGTSMAAPNVAGVAALVLQTAPFLSAGDLKALLMQTAERKTAYFGKSVTSGRVNGDAAVRYARSGARIGDADQDGFGDGQDACPRAAAPFSADGCPPVVDTDGDGLADGADNCPAVGNAAQADADGDGAGDACDPTPRGPDTDGDGIADMDDGCDGAPAATPDGCPPPPVAPPAAAPAPPAAAPAPPAAAPAIASLRVSVRGRTATLTVAARGTASLRISVQRQKGGRWVRVTRRTASAASGSARLVLRRLARGRYRAVAAPVGGDARAVAFRVR